VSSADPASDDPQQVPSDSGISLGSQQDRAFAESESPHPSAPQQAPPAKRTGIATAIASMRLSTR
jgi:hypothetical protein